ncbi:CopG family transcriptional regulator [Massilia sp. MB5]|uniref:CopG family transcriptional regulator n=1 Tax=unclassified Massilia TaxID=2609279 RepID=UPI00067A8F82|nr:MULTISPECIES: CopG family transcriptional regulator [unclassified Massilia]AKU22171.1 CopG family transcriptional regulator [Massilia sp. NR 4-1]UMR33073.1 CopG family transcriptional regulator [Massilia sp. MB5]
MPTTTIQLPQDLQARIAKVAERLGKTPQSFILEAIAEKADQEELRADFDTEADARFARILSSGETIPWADMRRYIEDRAQGKPATAPKPKKQA